MDEVGIIMLIIGDNVARKEPNMLWTIFGILLVLWLLGLFTGTTVGGFIHILLVIAIIVLLLNIFNGRKTKS